MLDVLVCICFGMGRKHMYSDNWLDCILWNVMYLECIYNMSSPKVHNVMYACMTELWCWLDVMRWHVFGVHVYHEFSKGLECHVCMYDRVMMLIGFVCMLYIWSACIAWVPQRFGISCMRVRLSYNDDLTCWDVKFWSVHMHVFPKGSEEMHAYIAEILHTCIS
jgi:hypothetical protein